MRSRILYLLFIMLSCLTSLPVLGQDQQPAEMADAMRSNGKIYVVVAVILTILAGLILYLVRLDGKITKLEKGEQ